MISWRQRADKITLFLFFTNDFHNEPRNLEISAKKIANFSVNLTFENLLSIIFLLWAVFSFDLVRIYWTTFDTNLEKMIETSRLETTETSHMNSKPNFRETSTLHNKLSVYLKSFFLYFIITNKVSWTYQIHI